MELDEYKIHISQKTGKTFHKAVPELEDYLRRQTDSLMDVLTKNLKLEIFFALLFLLFDCYVLLFVANNYLRVLALLLLAFCVYFIYYLVTLLRSIRFQHIILSSVKHLLQSYVHIIRRFTRLYFQLTMVIIPFIFLTAFLCAYLDYNNRATTLNNPFLARNVWLYVGISTAWSFGMYFFTRWYIKKLYGRHLRKLEHQLEELQAK